MKKINIAELLKDCPKGMELDCTMYEDVYFDYVDELNIIHCYIQRETYKTRITFNQCGAYNNSDVKSKCVIFPKGKTTWEGFQRSFKDGDVVATTDGTWLGITLGGTVGKFIPTYCVIDSGNEFRAYLERKQEWAFSRLATEEEKQKLFDAIKANGYKWNAETKTLEKLKKEKFDITTLKPFDEVLVRDNNEQKWTVDMFSFYDKTLIYPFNCIGHYVNQCIPYESNEHLLGTTNDCDEYYKTWK